MDVPKLRKRNTLHCKFICIAVSLSLYCFIPSKLFAQLPDFAPAQLNVYVDDALLELGFAGGLNAPNFASIDLNQDGVEDLVTFDRAGDVFSCFLRSESGGFSYAPEYVSIFPEGLSDWVLLNDLNSDGLPDLIAYDVTVKAIYLAYLDDSEQLAFSTTSLPMQFINEDGELQNLSTTNADMPGFFDVNADGDVDVLQFRFFGDRMEYFENLSMELGTDTLIYEKADKCWGQFAEDALNNDLILDLPCEEGHAPDLAPINHRQHAGSTVLAFDRNEDGLCDLLIGDASYPSLVMVNNAGTADMAYADWQDTEFPSYDVAVDIHLFTAAFEYDINGDDALDLIAAPTVVNAQAENHIWSYLKSDTSYQLQSTEFLVGDMIDVGTRSYPTFADYDNDGLLDLFVGHLGRFDTDEQQHFASLSLYRNIGTSTQPAFELVTEDFAGLAEYQFIGLYPTFGDLDEDGDLDMITGDELGQIHYFENTSDEGVPMQLNLNTPNLLELSPFNATIPQLYDVNGDDRLDLVIGEKSGTLLWWENTSAPASTTPSFESLEIFWGEVDVKELGSLFGYASPAIFEDASGEPLLLVNSEIGLIRAYTDLDNAVFTQLSEQVSGIHQGGRSGLAVADLNADGAPELVLGDYRGGLTLYSSGELISGLAENGASTLTNALSCSVSQISTDQFLLTADQVLDTPFDLAFYDVNGRSIPYAVQQIDAHSLKIQFESISSGIYIYQFTSGKQQISGNFTCLR